MRLHPGQVIAGSYTLERPLAVGGMGAVWVAWDPSIAQRVAIKFLDAQHADTELGRSRFEREATLLATIQNPHVVATREFRVEAETPFLVMELLDGEDLGARLRRVQRMPLVEVSHVLTQLARGLGAAHEAGIIHRDLKPANVFLANVDGVETVKLLDFGLAKNRTATEVGESTKTGELLGSPHFMSPEQIRSPSAIDHRSDLWSVAVILYRALTGELPFKGEQVGPVLARILTDPVSAPTVVAPDLPPALDDFFARSLARDPAQRYPSARELAHALATIAEAAPMPYLVLPTEMRLLPAQRGEMPPPPGETDDPTRVMPSPLNEGSVDDGVTLQASPNAIAKAKALATAAVGEEPFPQLAGGPVIGSRLIDDMPESLVDPTTTDGVTEPHPANLAKAGVYDPAPADPGAITQTPGPSPASRVPWAAIAFASACILCAAVFVAVGRAAAEDAARSAGSPLPPPSVNVAPPPAAATTASAEATPLPTPAQAPPTATAAESVTPAPSHVAPPPPAVRVPRTVPPTTAPQPRKKSAWGF